MQWTDVRGESHTFRLQDLTKAINDRMFRRSLTRKISISQKEFEST